MFIIFSFFHDEHDARLGLTQMVTSLLSPWEVNDSWTCVSNDTIGPHCLVDLMLNTVCQFLFKSNISRQSSHLVNIQKHLTILRNVEKPSPRSRRTSLRGGFPCTPHFVDSPEERFTWPHSKIFIQAQSPVLCVDLYSET